MSSNKFSRICILFFIFSTKLFAQQKVSLLNTKPSGANVLNGKKEVIGTTPFDLKNYPKKADTLIIALENFDTAYVAFPFGYSNLQFPQSTIYCEPCRIELNAGTDNESPAGTLVLRKRRPDQDMEEFNYFYAFMDSLQFEIADTTLVGKVEGNKKKWGDKKFKEITNPEFYASNPPTTGFYNSYLRVTPFEEGNKKFNRFKIKAKFKNLKFDFKEGEKGKLKGFYSIDSDWEIYGKYDSISPIARYTFHSSLYRTTNKTANFLSSLIHDSEKLLVSIDSLYDFLTVQEKKILNMSRGEVVQMKQPPHKTFSTLKEINRYAGPNVVTVEGEKSFGSGFFVSGNGYLVTNNHVIENEKKLKVRINKDLKLEAEVIKSNYEYDLALLKISYDSVPGLWLANSDSIDDGDPVVAIGTPLDRTLSSTLTKGIVSGKRDFSGIRMIQTDVSINSGNSGGPLINEKGEVIGMSTMKVKETGVEGIGFCIPSNDILKMLNIVYK